MTVILRVGADLAPAARGRLAASFRLVETALLVLLSFFAAGPVLGSAAEGRIVRSESLAPGLTFYEWRRGGSGPASGAFAVVAATEMKQKLADALLARVEGAGFRALPVYGRDGYEIRVSGLADRTRAEKVRATLIAAGFAPAEVREIGHDMAAPQGPFVAHILEVDPGLVDVVVAHARDAAIGLESTRDLARRRGALAAVNGGFFRVGGALAGESEGVLIADGRMLSEPDRGRAGFAVVHSADGTEALFDRLGFCAELRLPDGLPMAISGFNRERHPGEVVLYTPEFHRTTLTAPPGVEAIVETIGETTDEATVERLEIRQVRRDAGSSPIPHDGMVASFAPGVAEADRLQPGMRVALEWRVVAKSPDPEGLWTRARGALSAGPLLLRAGARVLRPDLEAISRVFTEARHPRTAVAARADGSLLFVTVDGRDPAWSVGMSLPELSDLLLDLGAVDAVNLDGGGSTTMVVRGDTVNRPSDPTGERANGDAILLFVR